MAVKEKTVAITATNDSTTSGHIDVRDYSCGSLLVPSSVTAIAFYKATSMTDAAPVVIRTQGNVALSVTTTAGTQVPLPAEIFSCRYIVPVLTGSASATLTAELGTSVSFPQSNLSVTVDSEMTTADLDTGAGTDTRAVVGVVLAASGGAAAQAGGAGAVNTGTQRVTLASDDPAVTSVQIMDDWDESDRAKVNPIVGQAGVAAGAGAVSATVQRVTLASDDPGVTSLQLIDDTISSTGATAACKSAAFQTSKTATVSAANTVAAAGDYAANDIMSNSATNNAGVAWKFTGLARIASGTGTIVGASIATSVEAFVPRVRLHLFSGNLTTATELDDNAALAIDLDERTLYFGYIDLPAMVDIGEFSFAQTDGLSKKFTADASGDVYAIVQLLDAVTNESAGMSVWPTLHVIQD